MPSLPPNAPPLPPCDDRPLWDIILSGNYLPSLAAADELGLFPLLEQGPATAAELARSLSLGLRGLRALLGLLTALGLLARHDDRFYLSPLARSYLLPGSPYYCGPALRGVRDMPLSFHTLVDCLKKEPDQDDGGGRPQDPELVIEQWQSEAPDRNYLREFTATMHSHSLPAALGLAQRAEFAGVRRLLDVGGGSGCYCIALAQRHPELRCTVAELPAVCELAQEYIRQSGLDARIDAHPLDMFRQPFPSGYDAILFSEVLHDWSLPQCRFLMEQSFACLPNGGRIFIHECLLGDSRDAPLAIASYSMMMFLNTAGEQRTAKDLSSLLGGAGFQEIRLTPSYGYFSLLSAIKP